MELKSFRFRFQWVLYFLLFAGVTGLAATWTVTFLVKQGEDVTVPNLTGKTLPEARYLLAQRDLKIEVLGVRYSDTFLADSTIYQTVPAGEEVRGGRTVGVYLSQGPRERTIPRVVGLERKAAETILQSSNLTGDEVATACSNDVPEGFVLAQAPSPGSPFTGDHVALLLSGGDCSDRYILGDVRGYDLEEVIEELDRNAFVVRTIEREERSELPSGVVARSKPLPGAVVHPFDPITLVVAAEPSYAGVEPRWERSQILYFPIASPPGLLQREAKLWIRRGADTGQTKIDFFLGPGEKQMRAVWLLPGSEVILRIDGQEIWRKIL